MGMYDSFEPDPPVLCPKCDTAPTEWQGKDADRLLFVWRQGHRGPVRHHMASEDQLTPEEAHEFRLPASFDFYGWDERGHRLDVRGFATDGVWTSTKLLAVDRVAVGEAMQLESTHTSARDAKPRWRRRALVLVVAASVHFLITLFLLAVGFGLGESQQPVDYWWVPLHQLMLGTLALPAILLWPVVRLVTSPHKFPFLEMAILNSFLWVMAARAIFRRYTTWRRNCQR